MRVAVIDIGSNSTRLLIAEVTPGGKVLPVLTDLRTTRLGEGIEGGMLLPQAVSRTIEAISGMLDTARANSAVKVVVVATSAVRDAVNRDQFIDEVYQRTGIRTQVLKGQEEAYLSYLGAAGEFPDLLSAVIVDIGGGSTEFTWRKNGEICCRSVNAGAVRMTEGGHDDDMIMEILEKALSEIRRAGPQKMIGVGGTATTLAAVDLALDEYDPSKVHGYVLDLEKIRIIFDRLVEAGPKGRKSIKGLQPARSDVILAGTRILTAVMRGLNLNSIIVSEADLMYGIAAGTVKPVETKKRGNVLK